MKAKSDQITLIAQQLGELRGITIKGFEQVNSHLATLNSKVASHEKRLNDYDIKDGREAGERNGIGLAWKIFITIATFAIGILTIIYFK